MQTFNYFYSNYDRLVSYINEDSIDLSTKALVQVFSGKEDKNKMQEALNAVSDILPNASIISTTTAGEIVEGGMSENTIVISVSIFENTDVQVGLFENNTPKDMAQSILNTMITARTKLIIIFNNLFNNDGELLIKEIGKLNNHKTMIAGGNAGDNHKFEKTFVGTGLELSSTSVAVAALDSDLLEVNNGYLLNWNKIGKTMLITRSVDSVIYEIDNKPAQDVYRHYLGDDVADMLPLSGIEFPLIFTKNNIEIARAPIAIGDDGSIIMAGHIEQNTKVQFAFGSQINNNKEVNYKLHELSKIPIESIFIYSCSARKSFLKNHLNDELNIFGKIASTAGFITYGEFYNSHLLNVSSSFVTLSESKTKENEILYKEDTFMQDKTIKALHHLLKITAKELDSNNYNSQQFKLLIRESTIYSATDTKGIIIDVNDKFCSISCYSKEELIGKSHNIVRDPNVNKEVYKDLWKTIQDKKTWKGIIQNRKKNGDTYYVLSTIMPITSVSGEILYYVSIRDDITQKVLEEKRLNNKVDFYVDLSKEQENRILQYKNVIDSNSAFIRVDSNFIITYINDVFCSIFKENKERLLGMQHNELIEPKFLKENKKKILKLIVENKKYSGTIKMQRFDKSIIYLDTTYSAIYDKDNKVIEYMATYHDITELIEIQGEIEKTQADVVFTMGSIGETRSKETGYHVIRVAEYSKQLALLYGLPEKEAELLKTASPMHDIGKVGIPDAILNKPAKLTEDEFHIMKTHSALGFNMLRHSTRPILNAAAIVALTHHERWDGKGYPKNLKGKRIPIFGRITSIADVFDALGSDRCYKKAWRDEDIFKLLKDGRGTQFDPDLIDIFFSNLDIFLDIRDKFKD